jgi:hypothetical protein
MWTLTFGHHEDRTPTHGYGATREDAMAAFAKSWRRHSRAAHAGCLLAHLYGGGGKLAIHAPRALAASIS